jgi:hypothetical protein
MSDESEVRESKSKSEYIYFNGFFLCMFYSERIADPTDIGAVRARLSTSPHVRTVLGMKASMFMRLPS